MTLPGRAHSVELTRPGDCAPPHPARSGAPTLARLQAPIAEHLAEAVRVFDAELDCDLAFVRDWCAHVARYRGKMLRPTLLLLAAQTVGRVRPAHVALAAVIEMIHVATLIHDDVLDDADVRRNAPTVHSMDGNEAAVLLGDYLISHAYHLCSSIDDARAARRVADATNRVCLGELMQVHHRGDWGMSEATYFEIIRRKTAELTRAACELGARHAGADEAAVAALADYGEHVGVAFQIVDDILDLTAEETEMGKTLGRDVDLAKPTLPIIHALAAATPAGREELLGLLTSCAPATRSGPLRTILESSDSLEYATAAARRYVDIARSRLAEFPRSEARDALTAAAEFVVQRRR